MVILDTNVVSEMMRPIPEPFVLRWFSNLSAEDSYLTAITVAEILLGIEFLPVGSRRETLREGAERTLAIFTDRILSFDDEAAREFALVSSDRRRKGRPMSEFDAQIAAIAKAQGASLATRNVDDFEGCGIRLMNPWRG